MTNTGLPSTFFRNFTSALTSNVLGMGIAALTTVIIVQSLSVREWAVTAVVVSMGPLFAMAISMGSVNYHVRDLSRLDVLASTRGFWRFMYHRLGWSVLLLIFGALLSATIDSGLPLAVSLLAATRFARAGSTTLLMAHKRFTAVALLNVGEKTIALGWVLATVHTGDVAVFTLVFALAAGQLVVVLMATLISRPRRSPSPPGRDLLYLWRGSGHFGITSLSGSLQQADVLIVTAIAGAQAGGYFAAAARVPGALSVVGSALALVVIPTFSAPTVHLTKALVNKLAIMWIAVFAGSVSLVFMAGFWVPLILGQEYVAAVSTIRIYLLAVAVNAVFQPAIAMLQARNADRIAALIVASQVVTTLASQALLAHLWGAEGAAAAYLVTLIVATVVTLLAIPRTMSFEHVGKD